VASLRRGGSASAFFLGGDLPDPQSEAFLAALERQRFRTIEDAASEETSVGWVCADDPSGESFPRETIDLDAAIWLQVRIDKKKLPARWVAIYRAAAERAAGRRLTGKERKALKEDLADKLLPRVLPSVSIVDVLLDPAHRRVLLFSTSKATRDEFGTLFRRTFPGVELLPGDAFHWATRTRITAEQRRYLDEVAPVKWPTQRRTEHAPPAETARDAIEVDA